VRFDIPGVVAQRAAVSGLPNERAPLQMVDALYRRGVFLTVGWQVSLGVKAPTARDLPLLMHHRYEVSSVPGSPFSMPSSWNLHRVVTPARWFAA
jgi:hypothetical protein